MIQYHRFTLNNGLKVILHQDKTSPMICVNILYQVGARDEDPAKTGFAHLFEHLMFGGSKHIPSYDEVLDKAGGENNAFTNSDITNYYLSLPKEFLELALWLESDRMLGPNFSKKSIDTQKNVVIEEFKQHYLNQPYGDVYHLLKPLAYKTHPYQWNTIGKEISHIEEATTEEVKSFFKKFYSPNNAILCLAGDLELSHCKALCEKWFGSIPSSETVLRKLPQEEIQREERCLHVEREVPANAIYKAFHIGKRLDPSYYSIDLLSDILSNGKSSRLHTELVKNKQLFTEINAYLTGDVDPGLFIISGKLHPEVSMEEADSAIWTELEKTKEVKISDYEMEKVKNKVVSYQAFSNYKLLEKAMNLAYFEFLGDIDLINTENAFYQEVQTEGILQIAKRTFTKENCSTLFYHAKA